MWPLGRRSRKLLGCARLEKAGARVHDHCSRWSIGSCFTYIAPYAGCAIAEYSWRRARTLILMIFQARLGLPRNFLLRRPPGREAYPGRFTCTRVARGAARVSDEHGDPLPLCRLLKPAATFRPTSQQTFHYRRSIYPRAISSTAVSARRSTLVCRSHVLVRRLRRGYEIGC